MTLLLVPKLCSGPIQGHSASRKTLVVGHFLELSGNRAMSNLIVVVAIEIANDKQA